MSRISVISGDITSLDVDVIVNAANAQLQGGGGVDGAIHHAAGPELLAQCAAIYRQNGACPTGQAVITGAGDLPVKAIIHAVGPVWHGGDRDEAGLLADAYHNSLQLAASHGFQRIAFPAISTGVYGYPKPAAAQIAMSTVCDFLHNHSLPHQVVFCCYDQETHDLYQHLLMNCDVV
ncbi:O-acetyl-ADP-ribose deacetylase [Mangrovibacter sp. SLW1]